MASLKTPDSATDHESTEVTKRVDATTVAHSPNNKDKSKKPEIAISNAEEASSRGWYGGRSWPKIQKSNPSIQVVKESILANKSGNSTIPTEVALFDQGMPPREQSLKHISSRSPSSTKTGNGKLTPELISAESPIVYNTARGNFDTTRNEAMELTDDHSANTPDALQSHRDNSKFEPSGILDPQRKSGWLDWLRPVKIKDDLARSQEVSQPTDKSQPPDEVASDISVDGKKSQYISTSILVADPQKEDEIIQQKPTKTASLWPGIWPAPSASKAAISKEAINLPETIISDSTVGNNDQSNNITRSGSSWGFWSRQTPSVTQSYSDEPGELAVTGEPSQDHPVLAHSNGLRNSKAETGQQLNRTKPLSETPGKKSSVEFSTKPTECSGSSATKTYAPNLLLPSFNNTYRLVESPSIIQQISRLLFRSNQPPTNHLFLIKDPPKIKKAIAIGIHGLFPAALLRTVIGQPNGTSIRFANHAAAAIDRWASKCGIQCDIEKIALEGEGKIAERVDHLWKLLLNWIEHVRQADFILVACHSQGVPVAMMLTAKLISLGVINSARIGVCAMAGVSLGPFPDYKSRFFSGSAAELFEFADLDSEVSRSYHEALSIALKYGVRVTYIGSIDDQLVPLESAVFSPVDHPYIYRSVFVDGRIHAPDFITNLVGFALKLRNLGVSDHQLIKALSTPLAGSLYSGEGHSRLYDEEGIYDLCVQFALETTSVDDGVALKVQRDGASSNSNPFQLPWSMRGLLEEDVVKTELDHEAKELLLQFEEWKPSSKVLKDVKYRLEVIKSKL